MVKVNRQDFAKFLNAEKIGHALCFKGVELGAASFRLADGNFCEEVHLNTHTSAHGDTDVSVEPLTELGALAVELFLQKD